MRITIILFAILFYSCESNKNKDDIAEVGKYVYIDKDGVLHVKQHCTKFILKEEQDFGVKRLPSETIPPEYLDNTCSYCVNDAMYDVLESRKGKRKLPGLSEDDSMDLHLK